MLQIVLLNSPFNIVYLSSESFEKFSDKRIRLNVNLSGVSAEPIQTWKELTNVESPKICAVNAMLVSLSNIP